MAEKAQKSRLTGLQFAAKMADVACYSPEQLQALRRRRARRFVAVIVTATSLLMMGAFGSPRRLPRTRIPSLYGTFYSVMRDEEFRQAFRTPRPVFLRLVEGLRATLASRCVFGNQ